VARRRVRAIIKRRLARTGWELRRTDRFEAATQATIDAVKPYTMTSPDRVAALCEAVRYIDRFDIPGAVVECGVWAGGSMMAAARTLRELGDTSRDIYLFDTFEGMTEPTDDDVDSAGTQASTRLAAHPDKSATIWAYAPIEQVARNLDSTGYPRERFRFVRGRVEDTIPEQAPEQIALLRLDTDWYESTRHELAHLIDRMSNHAVLIIDDYGFWAGQRKAVDEWLDGLHIPVFLIRVDAAGRTAVIPSR
jgi:hypothetical protein